MGGTLMNEPNDFSTDNLVVICTEYSINSVAEEVLKIPYVKEWADKMFPRYDAWTHPGCEAILRDPILLKGAQSHYFFLCSLREEFPGEWLEAKNKVGNL